MSSFVQTYLTEAMSILERLDIDAIENLVRELSSVKKSGARLFILGVGGSAGHASHAVNDFRKICALEAYSPTDNVSELTARINDDGWENCFADWLKSSRLKSEDAILVFSVGGGNIQKGVSLNIVKALQYGKKIGSKILGIVGKNGGFTREMSDACVTIPPLIEERITPHTEGICAVLWHLVVSHPSLQEYSAKWESLKSI